jgi:hypothetical protein
LQNVSFPSIVKYSKISVGWIRVSDCPGGGGACPEPRRPGLATGIRVIRVIIISDSNSEARQVEDAAVLLRVRLHRLRLVGRLCRCMIMIMMEFKLYHCRARH